MIASQAYSAYVLVHQMCLKWMTFLHLKNADFGPYQWSPSNLLCLMPFLCPAIHTEKQCRKEGRRVIRKRKENNVVKLHIQKLRKILLQFLSILLFVIDKTTISKFTLIAYACSVCNRLRALNCMKQKSSSSNLMRTTEMCCAFFASIFSLCNVVE